LPPVFMSGQATVHSGAETVKALWEEGDFTWDIGQFFSEGFDNPDLLVSHCYSYQEFSDYARQFRHELGPKPFVLLEPDIVSRRRMREHDELGKVLAPASNRFR
jgi:hypothetical protein